MTRRQIEIISLLLANATIGIPLFLHAMRRAQRAGVLPAVLALGAVGFVVVGAVLLEELVRAGVVPYQVRYLSAALWLALGVILIVKAWSGRTRVDEQFADIGIFGIERRFTRSLGRRYYNLKWFMVGLTCVVVGIRVMFR